MSEVTYIEWAAPQGSRLPEIAGQWNDIWDARTHVISLSRKIGTQDIEGIEASTTAALVKYFRPFGTGRRNRIDVSALSSQPEKRTLHEYLKAIRDWHIVHPVNRHEIHNVTVSVNNLGSNSAEATGVSDSSTSILPMTESIVEEFIELCNFWLDLLNAYKAEETRNLFQLARKLSADELNQIASRPTNQPDDNPFKHRASPPPR